VSVLPIDGRPLIAVPVFISVNIDRMIQISSGVDLQPGVALGRRKLWFSGAVAYGLAAGSHHHCFLPRKPHPATGIHLQKVAGKRQAGKPADSA
jgi:hypothetical protein